MLKFLLQAENSRSNFRWQLQRVMEREIINNEKQLFSRIIFLYFRKKIILQKILNQFLKKKPVQTSWLILMIGTLLLLFFQKIPHYTIVNELVENTPAKDKKMVNAILRKISESQQLLLQQIAASSDLCLKYAIDQSYIRELKKITVDLEKELAYLDSEPNFQIFPYLPRLSFSDLQSILNQNGIEFRIQKNLESFEVGSLAAVRRKILTKFPAYIQNSSSHLVSRIAAHFFSDQRIFLDVAAAPGSKTIALKSLQPKARIVASDLNFKRLSLLEDFQKRWSLKRVSLMHADALSLPLKDDADYFLIADLSCTSTGTLRKNPDLKSCFPEKEAKKQAELQLKILTALATKFPKKPILYSVCSFLEEETEKVIKGLNSAFNLNFIELDRLIARFGFNYSHKEYGYYLLSSENKNDFFYLTLFSATPR